jgi:deoxyribonuclease-4
MKYVGPHVSAAGGLHNAPLNAKKVGATAFGVFTKSPRRWKADPLQPADIKAFKAAMKSCGYAPKLVLAHVGYLLNPAHPDTSQRRDTWKAFADEVLRAQQLGLRLINTHPGRFDAQTKAGTSLAWVSDCFNHALDKTRGVRILLENMSGASSIGSRFEHLAAIIDKVEDKKRVGVCFDTCHAFGAGYDVRTRDALNATMAELRKIIGTKYLKGLHLNDAKIEFDSGKDRHESIGKGRIGKTCFQLIMADKRFDNMPLILETPDEELWPREVKTLRRWTGSR